ncbi:Uu.00g107000.m01.CDS01 [Anthostomella pinea]|uniref:Uu.00g107000.m01.CDS01 n=1 Tax=Anthostomella pinea TaxID=933095 RepID=A0AAI8VE44_9PEZI|nr:Uu.00g107000.m01.CDS01 [Anthostomella pinea]
MAIEDKVMMHDVQPGSPADSELGETKGVVVDEKADVGLKFLAQTGPVEYTNEEVKQVRWKIDLFFLPILCITFGLQYLDKVTVSYAAIWGLKTDLGLVGQEYSWTASIFYFGYLVAEAPASYLLARFSTRKFAGISVFIWGVMVICCAAAQNFASIMVLRFLMGIFEAGIGPCWIALTGSFYHKDEQGARMTAWYSFVGLAAIVGGLLSYGVGHIDSHLSQWRYVFIICGSLTLAWSLVIYFFLPSDPTEARFLTPRQRVIAVERLRANRTGLRSSQFKWSQALQALTDPQCWMIALWSGISQITNIAGSFLPLIIKDMGYTGLTTTLLTLPVGGIEIVAMLVAGVLSSNVKNGRTVIMFFVAAPTLAGIVMLDQLSQDSKWARTAAVWLVLCVPASYAVLFSLITSNVAGYSKKLTCSAMSFILWCVGNIVSPQLFKAGEAPRYQTGTRGMLVAIVLVEAITIGLGVYYYLVNKARDRAAAALVQDDRVADVENEEFLDRTDKEDWVKFRYSW